MRDKKVLCTGASGFIGSHLVDKLLKLGCEVTVVDNLSRGRAENLQHCLKDITFIQADLRECFPALPYQPEVVFDLAAKVFGIRFLYENPASMVMDNNLITINTLKRLHDVEKYVLLSSSCVYDHDQAKIPHDEDDVGLLNSYYGWSKYIAEIYAHSCGIEYGLDFTIVRPFNVYGPKESFKYPHVLPDFIMQAHQCKYNGKSEFKILGDGTQTRSFTYIDDCVAGIILAADKGGNTAYNLGTETEVSINELAAIVLKEYGISPPIGYIEGVKGDVSRRCASGAKARRELGWIPKEGLKEGIHKVVRWYESNITALGR